MNTRSTQTLLMSAWTLLAFTIVAIIGVAPSVWAQNIQFQIIPEAEQRDQWPQSVQTIGEARGEVVETYNQEADKLALWDQFASGIMNWDTILDYASYLVKFLANLAMVIGSATVIYAGYLYVMSGYSGDKASQANAAIKYAIIGIMVVIFSYAIMRILISAFL